MPFVPLLLHTHAQYIHRPGTGSDQINNVVRAGYDDEDEEFSCGIIIILEAALSYCIICMPCIGIDIIFEPHMILYYTTHP